MIRLVNNINMLSSSHVPDGETHPVMNDLLPPGPLNEIYFGYNKKWWWVAPGCISLHNNAAWWADDKNLLLRIREYRNDPNVLLLHYANVRKDLKGSVAKIADFVGVELSPEELDVGT